MKNISYHLIDLLFRIRLKAEVYTPDQSFSSTSVNTRSTVTTENCSTVFNFLESLSERIPLENKHPNAKSYVLLINILHQEFLFLFKRYFLQSGFNGKEKRQELANELLSIFNKDVFSSQVNFIFLHFIRIVSFFSSPIKSVWYGVVV